ncbi:pyruvate dehydrogenase E1 component alpha subunit [Kytococcus aerolatus]|uniref:Pyruvate dehydrogenase E1 component alpha subunit n=1 Tax=Kytococcus aerolatus TaxID=592308 RepID=A0A212U5N1_9MICO|nr:pyruvate dehydrogenase (acetyl-transferring) E1 component subunit alpha [Kytococcus aerolatus]SNC73460.1 pyruvate dehydrogenase E1 component alpha subunit [Kytococcus aerolatus]
MSTPQDLLPSPEPVQLIGPGGEPTVQEHPRGYALPPTERLLALHRAMVLGRRFDTQATALTKQGRLAVYPSSIGQDACQVATVSALEEGDWFFPTYRDSMALFTRGIDPVQVLTLLKGDWHAGYDVAATRTAPQCTPLATQLIHAAGAGAGMARRREGGAVLAFIGDGATSEGDFHEGLNFAAVYKAPVVFVVQNNAYAISVPLSKQTKAPSLAYKGIGYGIPSEQVDGNDAAAVAAVMDTALERARSGGGPTLVELHTYRMDAHTNADDATRYRESAEVDAWREKDPIVRLEKHLLDTGALTEERLEEIRAEAEEMAATLRERMNTDAEHDPLSLFEHVYAEPTPQLLEQRAMVAAELAAATADSQEATR